MRSSSATPRSRTAEITRSKSLPRGGRAESFGRAQLVHAGVDQSGSQSARGRRSDDVFSRLYEDAGRQGERRQQMQRSKSEAELSSVLSTPSVVSANSRRMLELRGESGSSASERLYSQGVRRPWTLLAYGCFA